MFWPYSPFAQPTTSFQRPVPLIFVDPCDNPDIRLEFRHEWLPYILGALKQLLLQTTWKTDNAEDFYHVQGLVANLFTCFMAQEPNTPCPEPILEMPYEMSICEQLRFNENGILQALCCGEWTDIAGQEGAAGQGRQPQPGGGAPQPQPGGGCQTYHATFDADGQFLLPVLVSAGDTLEFSNATGAGWDGATLNTWTCPNGQSFFGGACVGIPGPSFRDLTSIVGHMALVAIIDGTYYKAYEGTITVPGGVSNAQVVIQVNDDHTYKRAGNYTVDVEVCNNALASWCHYIDFRLTDGGFAPITLDSYVQGHYVPGQGFVYSDVLNSTSTAFRRVLIARHGIAAMNISRIEMLYTLAIGTAINPTDFQGGIYTQPGNVAWGDKFFSAPLSNGTNVAYSILRAETGVTGIDLDLVSASNASLGSLNGNAVITGVRVYGTGSNPFGSSNC